MWMEKNILILRSKSLVTYGEGVRHLTMPVQGQSFVLIKPLFLEIGSKNMISALAIKALHAWGALRFGF